MYSTTSGGSSEVVSVVSTVAGSSAVVCAVSMGPSSSSDSWAADTGDSDGAVVVSSCPEATASGTAATWAGGGVTGSKSLAAFSGFGALGPIPNRTETWTPWTWPPSPTTGLAPPSEPSTDRLFAVTASGHLQCAHICSNLDGQRLWFVPRKSLSITDLQLKSEVTLFLTPY